MFNLDPAVYEAIIAASLAVTVLALIVLGRKSAEAAKAKEATKKITVAATKAVITGAMLAAAEVSKWQRRAMLAEIRADEAERSAMEAAADADDAHDDAHPFGRNGDPLHDLLGDVLSGARNSGRRPVSPLDALLFGGPGPGVRSFRLGRDGDPFGPSTFTRDTGERPPSIGDIERALRNLSPDDVKQSLRTGDHSAITDALGLPRDAVLGVDVLDGKTGRVLTGAEREEAINNIVGETPEDGAARTFGPESGAHNPDAVKASLGGSDPYAAIANQVKDAHPAEAEACDTQRPKDPEWHEPGARAVPRFTDDLPSSPRAG